MVVRVRPLVDSWAARPAAAAAAAAPDPIDAVEAICHVKCCRLFVAPAAADAGPGPRASLRRPSAADAADRCVQCGIARGQHATPATPMAAAAAAGPRNTPNRTAYGTLLFPGSAAAAGSSSSSKVGVGVTDSITPSRQHD
jgi:hypothetical protein